MQSSDTLSATAFLPAPGSQFDSRRHNDERARQATASMLAVAPRLPRREGVVRSEVLSKQGGSAELDKRYQAAVLADQKEALPANRAVAEYVITQQQDLIGGLQNLIDVFV
ncbi:MAG: hypothetical protein BMS9Abin26_2085 [Gammaproteobacteria bacterium]|nr:MAG: hypothetical protein BMS9Abin26_2085 [Gammaproteobacteria bacterium]